MTILPKINLRRLLNHTVKSTGLALIVLSAGCNGPRESRPFIVGDEGEWEPWTILESSQPEFPTWVNAPPAGTVVAEGSAYQTKKAREHANLQLVQNAALTVGVQVQSEFVRRDTQDSFKANSTTSYSLNSEISVVVKKSYWQKRQAKGMQLGLPATKTEYQWYLLGKVSK